MKFLFVLFSIVCFGFAICVGQYHSLQVQLEPSLYEDQHYYQVTATCITNGTVPSLTKTSDEFELQNNAYNTVELKLFKNYCTSLKYQISITMVHKKDRCQKIWQSHHLSEHLADKPMKFLPVKFANHFKLVISPELLENSKISYRVEVYCAGNDQIEFKTYTSFSTMVVFNSVEQKCNSVERKDNYYDIKVWAFNYERKALTGGLLPLNDDQFKDGRQILGVQILNGHTYQFNFVTFEAQQPSTPSASSWNTKAEMKRLSSEIDTLGSEVKQLKNDVEQMRESIKTGLTEIKNFLSKKLKN